MEITRYPLALAATAALLALPAVPAQAQDDAGAGETRPFTWRIDPIAFGLFVADRDRNSAKFDEYRDQSDAAVMPQLGIQGSSGDGNRVFELLARDVRRDDARYTLSFSDAGRYNLLLDWNRIPHRFGNDGRILHSEIGPGMFEIADPIQAALQDAIAQQFVARPAGINFPFLNNLVSPLLATAPGLDPMLQRDRMLAQVDINKMGDLAGLIQFTHENRKGSRPYGAGFGFSNAIELPEPIDYDTVGATVSGEWRGKRAGARIGYSLSRFVNHIDSLSYDNPFRSTDASDAAAYQSPGAGSIGGAAIGRNAMAPDSIENRLFGSAHTKIGKRGWINGSVNYAIDKQDDPLLPYSSNSAINAATGAPFDVTDAANLPVDKADGDVRVLTTNANAGFALGGGWNLTLRYRLHDYDNRSSRIEMPGYVRFDAVWEEIPRITVPYEYRRQNAGAELGWNIGRNSHFSVLYTRDHWNRSFREVRKTDEDRIKASLSTRYTDRLTLRGSWEYGDRSTGAYRTEAQLDSFGHDEAVNNLPGLRKFDQAPLKYHNYNLRAEVFPSEKVDMSFGITRRKLNYDESEFGLQHDRTWLYSAEINCATSKSANTYVFWNRSDRDSFQRNRQSGATPSVREIDNWTALLSEVTDTLGAGFATSFAKRWRADVSASWNRANGNTDLASPPGGTPDGAVGFPEYDDNEWTTAQGKLIYTVDDHLSVQALYRWEEYRADRFAREGLANYAPGLLAINGNDGDYSADVFALDLRLRF